MTKITIDIDLEWLSACSLGVLLFELGDIDPDSERVDRAYNMLWEELKGRTTPGFEDYYIESAEALLRLSSEIVAKNIAEDKMLIEEFVRGIAGSMREAA